MTNDYEKTRARLQEALDVEIRNLGAGWSRVESKVYPIWEFKLETGASRRRPHLVSVFVSGYEYGITLSYLGRDRHTSPLSLSDVIRHAKDAVKNATA